jgi:hypothetical protein
LYRERPLITQNEEDSTFSSSNSCIMAYYCEAAFKAARRVMRDARCAPLAACCPPIAAGAGAGAGATELVLVRHWHMVRVARGSYNKHKHLGLGLLGGGLQAARAGGARSAVWGVGGIASAPFPTWTGAQKKRAAVCSE